MGVPTVNHGVVLWVGCCPESPRRLPRGIHPMRHSTVPSGAYHSIQKVIGTRCVYEIKAPLVIDSWLGLVGLGLEFGVAQRPSSTSSYVGGMLSSWWEPRNAPILSSFIHGLDHESTPRRTPWGATMKPHGTRTGIDSCINEPSHRPYSAYLLERGTGSTTIQHQLPTGCPNVHSIGHPIVQVYFHPIHYRRPPFSCSFLVVTEIGGKLL